MKKAKMDDPTPLQDRMFPTSLILTCCQKHLEWQELLWYQQQCTGGSTTRKSHGPLGGSYAHKRCEIQRQPQLPYGAKQKAFFALTRWNANRWLLFVQPCRDGNDQGKVKEHNAKKFAPTITPHGNVAQVNTVHEKCNSELGTVY